MVRENCDNWEIIVKKMEKKLCKRNVDIKKNLIKKMLEKTEEKIRRKIIIIFFCFGCATQNKALGMMRLVSTLFFFSLKNVWCKFQKNR